MGSSPFFVFFFCKTFGPSSHRSTCECVHDIHPSIHIALRENTKQTWFSEQKQIGDQAALSVVHSKSCIFSAKISNNSYARTTRKHNFWSCSTSIIPQVFHYLTRGPYSRILFLTGAMALNCLCLLLWRQLGTLLLPRYTCHHQKIHTC